MAAWPVLAVDGTITACCNQDVVDGRSRPAHLVLGQAATDGWREVRDRSQDSPLLRSVRTVGPRYLADRAGCAVSGYCDACQRLGDAPGTRDWAERIGGSAGGELLQEAAIRAGRAGGAEALVRRYGSARHAHWVGAGAGRSA